MHVIKFSSIALGCLLGPALVAGSARAGVEVISTQSRNLYRLALAEFDGRAAAKEIVGSTYDHRVCAFALDGRHLWDAPAGAFVFDLATGDLNADGRDEVVTAGADGMVRVFDATGRRLWAADLQAPVYQVCVAKLDGKTPVILAGGVSRQVVAFSATGAKLKSVEVNGAVRVMQAADFDGDGADEVAVLPIRGQPQDLVVLKGAGLSRVKDLGAGGSPALLRVQPAKSGNATTGDLDGDGAAELICNSGAYTLKGGLRPVFTLPAKFRVPSYDQYYNMRLLAAGDLTDRRGLETVVVEGPQVRLYAASGEELGHAAAPFGFTDVIHVPGSPRGSVILGSSPNGDDNLYRLTFEPGWEKALEQLERRGFIAGVGVALEKLGATAAAWRGSPMDGADAPFEVIVNHHFWNGGNARTYDSWIAEVREHQEKFPYPRLRFATAFWPGENAPLLRPDGKPWGRDRRLAHDLTREQIVAGAKHFESVRCPFWVQVGHGCDPHLEVATVAAMLDAAPTMLIGFIDSEEEQPDVLPYYMEHHIKPILELCRKHEKRLILRNKNVWWAHWPADPKMRELIFNGRYRSVILPCVEDSNSRSPDLNLAARVGLWLDGQVDDWASRCSADWFSFNRAWEWEYVMTGHPHLRYYVSQAMLGARVFMMLNGESERTGRWTRVGTEGTTTFLHLLGRGALTPPKREQLRAISPVALVMQSPSERFSRHGFNGHHEEWWGSDGTDDRPWAFDRLDCYWGMAPLPPTDVATYLWGRTRRDPSHLATTTPHGFVCIVPGSAPRPGGPWTTTWTTDGDLLSKHGKTFNLADARVAITADLERGAAAFPFAVEGRVFHQVVEQSRDRYIIALVDSGWVDPADRDVTLAAHRSGPWQVTDRLTGSKLGNLDKALKLRVPAGAFRLLEVHH